MTDAPFADTRDPALAEQAGTPLVEKRHATAAGKIAYWVSAGAGSGAEPGAAAGAGRASGVGPAGLAKPSEPAVSVGSAEPPERFGPTESAEPVGSAKPSGHNRPWLVFLPGLTADHRLFEDQVACFAGSMNVLVWDPPSHGRSRPFALSWTLDDLATWLHEILQAEGVRSPILVGQSMGGYVAQAYLRLYPTDARGFVSIDSCPLDFEYYTRLELFLLRHTKLMYLSIPWGTLVKLGSEGCATSAHSRQLMRTMMASYEKRAYCELAAHGYQVLADAVAPDREYSLPCPTLLICGEKDGAGSARRYNRAWANRCGLTLHWIEGAGHNSNTDDPNAVNALIEEFVRSLDAGRSDRWGREGPGR